jgi:hypothetical protein
MECHTKPWVKAAVPTTRCRMSYCLAELPAGTAAAAARRHTGWHTSQPVSTWQQQQQGWQQQPTQLLVAVVLNLQRRHPLVPSHTTPARCRAAE